jgi:hypothetical protein
MRLWNKGDEATFQTLKARRAEADAARQALRLKLAAALEVEIPLAAQQAWASWPGITALADALIDRIQANEA